MADEIRVLLYIFVYLVWAFFMFDYRSAVIHGLWFCRIQDTRISQESSEDSAALSVRWTPVRNQAVKQRIIKVSWMDTNIFSWFMRFHISAFFCICSPVWMILLWFCSLAFASVVYFRQGNLYVLLWRNSCFKEIVCVFSLLLIHYPHTVHSVIAKVIGGKW